MIILKMKTVKLMSHRMLNFQDLLILIRKSKKHKLILISKYKKNQKKQLQKNQAKFGKTLESVEKNLANADSVIKELKKKLSSAESIIKKLKRLV